MTLNVVKGMDCFMSIKKMTKEELELLSYKDIANLLIEEKGKRNTLELFKEIVSLLELPTSILETKIGDFYTSLATDKRFVLLDGTWDLRSRHTSDKVVIKVEEDEEEIDDIKEEDLEEVEEEEEDFDTSEEEDAFDDNDDELKDLVVLDEEELEQ